MIADLRDVYPAAKPLRGAAETIQELSSPALLFGESIEEDANKHRLQISDV
jgi:hypothetical protein